MSIYELLDTVSNMEVTDKMVSEFNAVMNAAEAQFDLEFEQSKPGPDFYRRSYWI